MIDNSNILKRLTNKWHKRAGIYNQPFPLYQQPNNASCQVDATDRPPYPESLVPFIGHPDYQKASDSQKRYVLDLCWIAYNERVVASEEYIACPAFAMILQGVFPGAESYEMKKALQQCLIDEYFHSLMHTTAIEQAYQQTANHQTIKIPNSIIYSHLKNLQSHKEEWQKQILTLLWTIISEISVNAYLELLSEDQTIKHENRKLVWIHNRDEYAHSKITVEIMKHIYYKMDDKSKQFLVDNIPNSIIAFSLRDNSAFDYILKSANIKNYQSILYDISLNKEKNKLLRDFRWIYKLLDNLEIKIDHDRLLEYGIVC